MENSKYAVVKSKIPNRAYVVDLINRVYIHTTYDVIKVKNFNSEEHKYINDKYTIENSLATLAYVNNKLKVYGILKERGNKPAIAWISFKNLQNDTRVDELANFKGELVNVEEYGTLIFESAWKNKLKQNMLVDTLAWRVKLRELFLAEMRNEDTEDKKGTEDKKEQNLQANNEREKQNSVIMEDTENKPNASNTINKLLVELAEKVEKQEKILEQILIKSDTKNESVETNLIDRVSTILEREKALENKEQEFIQKQSQVNKILAVSSQLDIENMTDTIIDVGKIVGIDNNSKYEEENLTNLEFTYELILKMLQYQDSITVPITFYRKLKCLVNKNIEINTKYTKYKSLITIRFNINTEENLFGIVDFDEELDIVRITVLKPYNINTITQEEINKYVIDYSRLRKQINIIG